MPIMNNLKLKVQIEINAVGPEGAGKTMEINDLIAAIHNHYNDMGVSDADYVFSVSKHLDDHGATISIQLPSRNDPDATIRF